MENSLINTFDNIINDVAYNINIYKSVSGDMSPLLDNSINSIEIKFKNTRTKELYQTKLCSNDIVTITASEKLSLDLDDFYIFLLSALNQQNDKININCIENNDKLLINIFFTIECLNKKINYEVILHKIEQTDIDKIQEILSDINNTITTNKEMISSLKDEFIKLKQNIQHEIIDFRNKMNECRKKNGKWNHIDPNNSNYNFECEYRFSIHFSKDNFRYISDTKIHKPIGIFDMRNKNELCCNECSKSSRCKSCQNINNIFLWDANNREFKIVIIPNILQQSNKIKIYIYVRYHTSNIIKLYTNKTNAQYLICEETNKSYNDISSYKTFEITPSDTHICISSTGSDAEIIINLEAYKN